MVTMFLPLITTLYRKMMRRLKLWLLGPQPAEGLPLRRIELALNEGGPALHVRIAANLDHQEEAVNRQGVAAAPADERQPNDDAVAVAEQTVRVTGTSIGRFIGGALMIPSISNWMGSILYNLSRHSHFLRTFLGVRPPLLFTANSTRTVFENMGWQHPGKLKQLGANLRVIANIICGGTKVWAEADPVWWRNTVGLGIFVFVSVHYFLYYSSPDSRQGQGLSQSVTCLPD